MSAVWPLLLLLLLLVLLLLLLILSLLLLALAAALGQCEMSQLVCTRRVTFKVWSCFPGIFCWGGVVGRGVYVCFLLNLVSKASSSTLDLQHLRNEGAGVM